MPRRPAALFVAEGVALDQLTGRLTAFNILDNVFAAKLPALLPRVHVVGIFDLENTPESVFMRVELKDATGEAVSAPVVMPVELGGRTAGKPPVSHTTIHTLWNTAFRSEGDHRVVLSQAPSADGPWELLAERTFSVVAVPHPLAPAPKEREENPGQ